MRKGRNGEKRVGKKKIRMKIVATTSLPAVDRPNADRWNAARSCQFPNAGEEGWNPPKNSQSQFENFIKNQTSPFFYFIMIV